MVTVKQLEKRLKVSRVSIYSQIKKPEFKGHTFKDAVGVTQIDDVGLAMLEARYLHAQEETIRDIVTDELNAVEDDLSDNKPEVNVKNAEILVLLQHQLEAKDEQINHLLRIVSNQQQIHITHFLVDKPHSAVSRDEQLGEVEKPQPWYRRIFNIVRTGTV